MAAHHDGGAVDWQRTAFWRCAVRRGAARRHPRRRRPISLLAELQDVSNQGGGADTSNLAKELEKLWVSLRVPVADRKRQAKTLYPLSSRTHVQMKAQVARLVDIRCRLLDILEALARRENLFAAVCSELQDRERGSKEVVVRLAELCELDKALKRQLDEWDLIVPWSSPFVWSGTAYCDKLRSDAETLARLACVANNPPGE